MSEDKEPETELFELLKPIHAPILDDFRGMTAVAACTAETITKFEQIAIANNMNQIGELNAIGMEDTLKNGMYCRKLFIPRGTFLTGRVHKNPYIDMCISGDITVKSFLHDESVESSINIKGFKFLNGVAGRKRVGYAHKDTVWLTVDPCDVADIKDAEDAISYPDLSQFMKELSCQQVG